MTKNTAGVLVSWADYFQAEKGKVHDLSKHNSVELILPEDVLFNREDDIPVVMGVSFLEVEGALAEIMLRVEQIMTGLELQAQFEAGE